MYVRSNADDGFGEEWMVMLAQAGVRFRVFSWLKWSGAEDVADRI